MSCIFVTMLSESISYHPYAPPNSQFNSIDTNNPLLLFLLLVIIVKTHSSNRPFTSCIRSPSSSPHRYGPTSVGVVPNTNLRVHASSTMESTRSNSGSHSLGWLISVRCGHMPVWGSHLVERSYWTLWGWVSATILLVSSVLIFSPCVDF